MEFKRNPDKTSSTQKTKQVPKLKLDKVVVNLPNEYAQN